MTRISHDTPCSLRNDTNLEAHLRSTAHTSRNDQRLVCSGFLAEQTRMRRFIQSEQRATRCETRLLNLGHQPEMIAGPWTLAPSVTTTGLQEWQSMDGDGYTVSWRSLVTRGRDDVSYTNAFLENWFTQLRPFLSRVLSVLFQGAVQSLQQGL